VCLQQESILFVLLKVSQACLELVAGQVVGGGPVGWFLGRGLVGWWPGGPVRWQPRGPVGQRPGGLAGQLVGSGGWLWQPACSFSISWHGEGFHWLEVQGVNVSALPHDLSQLRVFPASQQGP
jgi:hypothetical protein